MVNQLECAQHWMICTALRRRRSERKDKGLSSDLFSESEDNNAVDGNESDSSGKGT